MEKWKADKKWLTKKKTFLKGGTRHKVCIFSKNANKKRFFFCQPFFEKILFVSKWFFFLKRYFLFQIVFLLGKLCFPWKTFGKGCIPLFKLFCISFGSSRDRKGKPRVSDK